MSKPDVWMPFFHKDFFNGTTHLNLEQQMAYLRLICGAWDRAGKLPLDMEQLRLISTMERKEWKKSGQILMDFFTKNDTFFSHKRVDKELEKANSNIDQKREAGLKSAAAKAEAKRRLVEEKEKKSGNGSSTGVETALSTDNPTGQATEGQRSGNPSPSPSPIIFDNEEEPPIIPHPELALTVPEPEPTIDEKFELFWEAYPPRRHPNGDLKKIGRKDARSAIEVALKKVDLNIILAAARDYAETEKPQFIKDAHRWLKGQRWEDETVGHARPELQNGFAELLARDWEASQSQPAPFFNTIPEIEHDGN